MKTTSKLLTILSIVFSFSTISLQAQKKPAAERTTVSIETDPSTFAFNGYAVHFRIKPASSKHFLLGAGTYAMDFPSFLVDMNSDNKDKSWNVRINSAFSVFGEYYFNEPNQRWFAGLQAGIQNYKNTNDNSPDLETKYSNLLLMPSVGYNWQPFLFPLYLKPWLGFGYTSKISGETVVENLEYKISPLVPFLTVHIGYTF